MCMTRDTPIPQQLDNFWVSLEKKFNLQLLVRDIVCNGDYVNTVIIASYVVSVYELLPEKAIGGADISKPLKWTEETDSWVVHVKQCMRAVILSNGTDKFALLLLHDVPYLQIQGLKDNWQQFRLVGMCRKVTIEKWICWKHLVSTFLLEIHISFFGNVDDLLCLSHFII